MEENELTKFIRQVDAFTKKPENYLSLQPGLAEEIILFTKDWYGFSKAKEYAIKPNEALNDLVIKNLDEEQIWQQIELQNNAIMDNLVSNVAHLLAKKNQLKFPLRDKNKEKEGKIKNKNDIHDDGYNRNDNEVEKTDEKINKIEKKPNRQVKTSVVDDKFFKLHEMEEFLEKMEKPKNSKQSDDEEDEEEEINYFDDDLSGSDEDLENQPKYGDFFDEPYDEVISDKTKRHLSESDDEARKSKKVKFALNGLDNGDYIEDEEDDDDDDDDDDGDKENEIGGSMDGENDVGASSDDEGLFDGITDENEIGNSEEEDEESIYNKTREKKKEGKNEPPSTFEARQERLKARIDKLEDSALKEKPWQMKGEITAEKRPQNSLLEEYVEFDIATRPAPILTEKSTLRLEDIIKQRIKDKAWDDVVRKIKPVGGEIEYKKKLVLDQEKSKLSLAQIYEQEYLKQAENKASENIVDKPEVEPPEHQEIKGLLKNLFSKLDALSNFHFTPKAVTTEVKIVSNLPAITMEEVVPVATSDAALLAPEEIRAPQKGELKGKSERTATDKKRERRKKKLAQKLKFKKIEEKAKEKLQNANGKSIQSKKLSNKLLQKITKSSNVTSLEENGGKYLKSSSAFFSKLQDETSGKIKKKKLELGNSKFKKKIKSKKH